jgi:hypothetical protein
MQAKLLPSSFTIAATDFYGSAKKVEAKPSMPRTKRGGSFEPYRCASSDFRCSVIANKLDLHFSDGCIKNCDSRFCLRCSRSAACCVQCSTIKASKPKRFRLSIGDARAPATKITDGSAETEAVTGLSSHAFRLGAAAASPAIIDDAKALPRLKTVKVSNAQDLIKPPVEFALKIAESSTGSALFSGAVVTVSPNTASSSGSAGGSSDPDVHHFTSTSTDQSFSRVKCGSSVANDATTKLVAPNPPGIAS